MAGRSRQFRKNQLPISRRVARRGRSVRCIAEPLESRRLFSAINWVNRGQTSDGFASVFGANANLARAVVDAVITSWARLINNFNYAGGGNTYNLTVQMATAGSSSGANAGPTHYNAGKPDQGTMTIGRGGDTTGDGLGDGGGYFLDPTPYDSLEFSSYTTSAFGAYADASSPAFNKGDLYEVCLHELGHALGIVNNGNNSTLFSSHTTKLSVGDGADPAINGQAGTVGFYYAFSGSTTHTLLTSYDSGGQSGTPTDAGGASHFAPPLSPAQTIAGITYYGADDLMTPYYYSGQRRLVSQNDIGMLADAYGYTVTNASNYGNVYTYLDSSGAIRIHTPGNGNDQISMSVSGIVLTINVSLGSPVLGADPTSYTSIFDIRNVSAFDIETGGGNDTITVVPFGNYPMTIVGGSGTDTLFLNGLTGTTTVTNTGITNPLFSAVTIASIDTLIMNGTNAAETFNISAQPFYSSIAINALGGNDVLNYGSGDLTADPATLSFDGGAGIDSITLGNSLSADSWFYDIGGDGLSATDATTGFLGLYTIVNAENATINSGSGNDIFTMFGSYAAGTTIRLSGGAGDDTFLLGYYQYDSNLAAFQGNVVIVGGPGTDAIAADDSTATNLRTYTVNAVSFKSNVSGNFNYDLDTEAVTISGPQDYASSFNVQPIGAIGSVPMTLVGGNYNDSFTFTSSIPPTANVVAGAGIDSMVVNDVANLNPPFRVILSSTALYRDVGAESSFLRSTINYSGIDSASYYGYNQPTRVEVHSLPVMAGSGWYFETGTAIDNFYIYPHDDAGNLALAASLLLNGRTSSDSVYIDDTASPVGANYTIFNQLLGPNQSVSGMTAGTATFGLTATESLLFLGSEFDDIYTVESFKSGMALTINANGGSDSVIVTPTSQNVPTSITNIALFTFDGGDGYDSLAVHNEANTSAWTYTVTSTYLLASRNSPAYILYFGDPNTESLDLRAGSGSDQINVQATAVGTTTYLDGGDGSTSYNLSSSGSVSDIGGAVYVSTHGSDTVSVDDTNDTVGRTLTLSDTSLGATPGDDLFPLGGSLNFVNNGYATLSIYLGPYADTVFAAPNPLLTVAIDGGDPTDIPGDTLTLDLANTLNPVFTPLTPTVTQLTSDNNQPFYYGNFENDASIDTTPPIPLSAHFDLFTNALSFAFSEPLAEGLDPAALALYDVSTGTPVLLDPATFAVSADFATKSLVFTFPGFEGGLLPAGLYQATLQGAAVTDRAGNPATSDISYSFLYAAAGQLAAIAPGQGTLRTQQIAIDPAGTADLADNSLVLDYDGVSPLFDLMPLLYSAYNAGPWTGTGLTSSAAANTPYHSLAYAEAADLLALSPDTVLTDTWQGQPVDTTSLLFKYTLIGDTNLDGTLDGFDQKHAIDGLSNGGSTYTQGDFNYDNVVDPTDYALLDAALNAPPQPPAAPAITFLSPIPGTLKAGQRLPKLTLPTSYTSDLSLTVLLNGVTISTTTAKLRNHQATFSNLSLTRAGTYTLRFSDGGSHTPATTMLTVAPANASRLIVNTTAPAEPPSVSITDKFGNLVDSTDSVVSLTLSGKSRSASAFSSTAILHNGTALFPNILRQAPGTYWLTARLGDLKSLSTKIILV